MSKIDLPNRETAQRILESLRRIPGNLRRKLTGLWASSLAGKILLASATVLTLLVLALAVFVLTFDAEQYREPIVTRLAEFFGRPVQADDVDLSLFPPSLTLNGLRVAEAEGFTGEHLLTVRGVKVGVSLLALLSGDLVADSLTLDGTHLFLRQNPDGIWNLSELASVAKPSSEEPDREKPTRSPVNNWKISDATLTVKTANAEPLSLKIFEADLKDISATEPFEFRMQGRLGNGVPFEAGGSLGPLDLESPDQTPISTLLTVEARLEDLSESVGLFVAGVPGTSGRLSVRIQVEGSPAALQEDGEAIFESVSIELEGLEAPARIESARISVKDGNLSVGEFSVDLSPEVALKVEGRVDGYRASPSLVGRAGGKALPLQALISLAGKLGLPVPEGVALTGLIDGEVSVSGPLDSDTISMQPKAQARLTEGTIQPAGWKEPLVVTGVDLRVEPEKAELDNLVASIGGTKLKGSLKLEDFDDPTVEFDLSGTSLNVEKLQAAVGVDGSKKDGKPRRPSGGQSASLPVRGTGKVHFDKFVQGSVTMAPFDAQIRLRKSSIVFQPMRFGLYGGSGSGRLVADLSGAQPSSHFKGSLNKVNVNRLANATSEAKDLIFGTLTAAVDLRTRGSDPDALRKNVKGTGSFRIVDGKMASFDLSRKLAALNKFARSPLPSDDTELEEMSSDFQLADEWVHTEALRIRTPDVAIIAKGRFSLEGALELQATGAFTPEMSKNLSPRGPLGLLSGLFKDDFGRLILPLDIKGTFEQPHLELDTIQLAKMKFGTPADPPPDPPREQKKKPTRGNKKKK